MRSALSLVLMLISCGCHGPGTDRNSGTEAGTMEEELIKENQRAMRIESRDIANYIERNGMKATETGSGLQVVMIRDVEGVTAAAGQFAVVNYDLLLLNGRQCYTSREKGAERFRVEHDHVESGLHEGIQYLSPGDSAVLVIPSHLAYGLIGDQDQIPMRSTIVYHIGLVELGDGK